MVYSEILQFIIVVWGCRSIITTPNKAMLMYSLTLVQPVLVTTCIKRPTLELQLQLFIAAIFPAEPLLKTEVDLTSQCAHYSVYHH